MLAAQNEGRGRTDARMRRWPRSACDVPRAGHRARGNKAVTIYLRSGSLDAGPAEREQLADEPVDRDRSRQHAEADGERDKEAAGRGRQREDDASPALSAAVEQMLSALLKLELMRVRRGSSG